MSSRPRSSTPGAATAPAAGPAAGSAIRAPRPVQHAVGVKLAPQAHERLAVRDQRGAGLRIAVAVGGGRRDLHHGQQRQPNRPVCSLNHGPQRGMSPGAAGCGEGAGRQRRDGY